MFDILVRLQRLQVLNGINAALQRLQYSDSSLVRSHLTLKSLEVQNRTRQKSEFKKHFIEELFLNKFDPTILEYPEINSLSEFESLQRHCDIAKNSLMKINSPENHICERKSDEVVSTVKQFELTGIKLPVNKSGFGYLETEYSYMKETLGYNTSLAKTILENEDFGIQLIEKFGSESQREKYLTKLSNSESLACFCHVESGPLVPINPISIETKAVKSPDGENYIVSGKKNWVYNASYADVLIFSANVQENKEEEKSKFTIFVIDKNLEGVTIHKPIKMVGLEGLDVCEVTFNEVVVPADCVLGKVHEGNELVQKIFSFGKLSNGSECIALMRKLVNKTVKHCIHKKFFKQNKYDKLFYKVKVGNLASRLYAVESMTYLVTGRKDKFNDADVFLESLILKIFASESLQYILKESLEILGTEFYLDDSLNEILRDSLFFTACEDSNDHLKCFLSTVGLQYILENKRKANLSIRLMETMTYPNVVYSLFGKTKTFRRFMMSKNRELTGFLHLVFQSESELLKDMVLKFSKMAEFLLKKYGDNVFNQEEDLKLLANLLVLIYAITATLGRASRAYCIAVRNQEIDFWIARSEVNFYSNQFDTIIDKFDINRGFENIDKLGSDIMANKKYPGNFPIFPSISIKQ